LIQLKITKTSNDIVYDVISFVTLYSMERHYFMIF
jgi:hypothetical protein